MSDTDVASTTHSSGVDVVSVTRSNNYCNVIISVTIITTSVAIAIMALTQCGSLYHEVFSGLGAGSGDNFGDGSVEISDFDLAFSALT